MDKIDTCPCCGKRDFKRFPAWVAPFIENYALEGDAPDCQLLECTGCAFRFFDHRFSTAESDRLYANYRADSYFRTRHRHEFWYTDQINAGLSSDSGNIEIRRNHIATFLAQHLPQAAMLESILDYGGDRGQFIPSGIARQRFVFEKSDAVPEAGVVRIESPEELRSAAPFSLVMLCHVLEHLSDPLQTVRELRGLLGSESAYLLIEVPHERYALGYSLPGVTSKLVTPMRRRKYARLLNEIYTLGFRNHCNLIPPFGISRLHEHINFFSDRSLAALLENADMSIVGHALVETPSRTGLEKSLLMLARSGNPSSHP